jgi:hypothetical protein
LTGVGARRHDRRAGTRRELTDLTDRREPPLEEPPPNLPDPDAPAVFVDAPEREPDRGHLMFVGLALVLMLLAWWGM